MRSVAQQFLPSEILKLSRQCPVENCQHAQDCDSGDCLQVNRKQAPTSTGRLFGLGSASMATEDSPRLKDAFQDRAIQFWRTRTISSNDEAEMLINDYAQDWRAETRANWAVVSLADELLGRVSLNPMNLEDGEAEIGYWVRSAARGQGVAVNAVELLTSWSFSVGFHRLIIHHSTTNPASCSVARKGAFDLEGTKKSALLHADGWHDMHLHARIAIATGLSEQRWI